MEAYTDYGFYKSTYKGNMPQDDFDKLVFKSKLRSTKKYFQQRCREL